MECDTLITEWEVILVVSILRDVIPPPFVFLPSVLSGCFATDYASPYAGVSAIMERQDILTVEAVR